MYTRKEFFIAIARNCLDFAKAYISTPLEIEEEFKKESDSSAYETLFLEAMNLGIDPGTMGSGQLLEAVRFAKEGEKSLRR